MDFSFRCLLALCAGSLLLCGSVSGFQPKSLFVIGDSYVDTGNVQRGTYPWKFPYGIFSGRPSGRLSDGKVLTDFVASFLKTPMPLPYALRDVNPRMLRYGMNLATGGAGVLMSALDAPTTGAQIQELQQQVSSKTYSPSDFGSSILLYSASGNDYTMYHLQGGSDQEMTAFTQSLVKEISSNLRTLYGMGFRRIAVMNLGPIGCVPDMTEALSYRSCNETVNRMAVVHNELLNQQLHSISQQHPDAKISVLDQYSGMLSILHNPGNLKDPLKPCCMGFCGFTDVDGRPLYSVCSNPGSSLFWDSMHPSEAGWRSLMPTFAPSLASVLA